MVAKAKHRRWLEPDSDHATLDRLAKHFEGCNQVDGKSPRTVEWYSRILRFFGGYLEEQGHSAKLGDLSLKVVREFVLHLQTRDKWNKHPYIPHREGNLAAISVQNYVRGLRAFFSWLYREGYTEENLLAELRPPKAPHKVVDVLTEEEVAQIMACLDVATHAL